MGQGSGKADSQNSRVAKISRQMRLRLNIRKNEYFLFILPNGNIPTSPMMGYNFIKFQKQIGVDKRDFISPHGLRHTFTIYAQSARR